ncbi:MAG: glycogen-binding domain-containing protein [Candidatus Eisenbacteria bacterium]|nr:glycogen-binding domain-containing protein [Candidatus Eisenbacteria bacterium]
MRTLLARSTFSLFMLLAAFSPARAGVQTVEGGILFSYTDAYAGQVSLAGAFNDWNTMANPMTRGEGGVWSVTVDLPEGKHEYKFVVDGQWVPDPDNPVTAGEYGNSVVVVGAGGGMETMTPTSNTAYSAKIFLGGRMISRFISRQNEEKGDRFELRRPTMDFDLDWKVRANDYLDLYMLTNINNENEETVTDFWKTKMRFDRGSLHYHGRRLDLKLFDGVSVGRFDDPLTLVGGIGIYDHDFGYNQQGAIAETEWGGLEFTFLYSDDFDNGGTTIPTLDSLGAAAEETVFDSTAGAYRFGGTRTAVYDASDDDNDKDVLAGRVAYPFRNLRFGASGRYDRGYNPGTLSLIESAVGETTGVQKKFAETWETWWAGGGDVVWGGGDSPWNVRAEVLHGRARIDALDGREADVVIRTSADASEVFADTLYTAEVVQLGENRRIEDGSYEIDRSTRWHLGGGYDFKEIGVAVDLAWERETHDQTYFATSIWDTLENKVDILRFRLDRECERFGRPVKIGLGIERFAFDYDERTPWANQFWLDYRNFWLEQGEHEVSVERLVLLGGRNAFIAEPTIRTTLWADKKLDFLYRGTIAGVDLDKAPKFVESLFRFEARPWRSIRLLSDTRLAKYNDPVLDVFSSYWCTFAEIAYEVAEGIELSLSFGVDPWVVDEMTNEFDEIGRDMFLFGRGANGDTARRNFLGLGEYIPEAEQALENERRIQIEGIVRF